MGSIVIRSSSGATIIEFISTPGAGKTSLCAAVREFFAERGQRALVVMDASRLFASRTRAGGLVASLAPASLQGPLLWQVFYQASRLNRVGFRSEHRALIQAVEDFQRGRPIPEGDRQHVMGWFTNLIGQYRFLKTHAEKGDVLVFDEGFIHRVVQLFASEAEALNPSRIRSYLDLVPLPDLIIQPQASLETCIERVYHRGIWERFRGRDEAAVRRFMQNAHAAVGIAVEHIAARGWPLLQVVNEGHPAAESARQLKMKLASMHLVASDAINLPVNA